MTRDAAIRNERTWSVPVPGKKPSTFTDVPVEFSLDGATIYTMTFSGPGAHDRAESAIRQWRDGVPWARRVVEAHHARQTASRAESA